MTDFRKLYNEAHKAGMEAARATTPTPMTVYEADVITGERIGRQWHVPQGVCGFASIHIKPGNSKFANWLKKEGLAKKHSYYGGVYIWVSDFGQSMELKGAYAYAFAEVLREAGIRAYSQTRMD